MGERKRKKKTFVLILKIIGAAGAVIVYDEALFHFSKVAEVEYLPWRVWIGFWSAIIAVTVAAFQGSVVVKFFTKFTQGPVL
jgi:hypothetical protein